MDCRLMDQYIDILQEELLPAMGCTEPIAVAYCAAYMKKLLGALPDEILCEVSGNILKNVKSVIVPNAGGLFGVQAAVAAGVVAGNPDKQLEVLAEVTPEEEKQIKVYMEQAKIDVVCFDTTRMLDIRITGKKDGHTAVAHIANNHTNVIYAECDGKVLLELPLNDNAEDNLTDKSILNIRSIIEFAETVDVERIRPLIQKQIDCNVAIAEEGIRNSWGANIGSVLLKTRPNDVYAEVAAYAAAGSDARMSGCEVPVVIVSGSGNQGITASVPVARFAKIIGASEEKMLRAVALSDLITVHQKTGIGRLSAYCGAVSAGCGAACGIAWLDGADYEGISHTIKNCLGITSGIICDGAKSSCAGKIATAVQTGLLGYEMYKTNNNFKGGDGILSDGIEETIKSIGVLAREGMQQTDRTILGIMLEN